MYIRSNKCEDVINIRSLDFESSELDHERRNNHYLKLGHIWYLPERERDYYFNFSKVGTSIFHGRMEVFNITEDSLKFHLNQTLDSEKALYQA